MSERGPTRDAPAPSDADAAEGPPEPAATPASPGAGEPDAFEALFEAYRGDVARLCTRILGPGADAEDAASEAFLRARSRFSRYDPKQPFRRWLLALASHLCIDRIRRRKVEGRIFDPGFDVDAASDEALPGASLSPLRSALHAEDRRRLLAAIDALPVRDRTLLAMRHFAELGYAEIAEASGLPLERIGSQLHRARLRLRAELVARGGR